MPKQAKHLWAVVVIVSLIVAGGLIGCSLLDQGQDSPTAPAAGSADDLANLYVNRGSSEGYGVYTQPGLLVVNLPAAGDYVIAYSTSNGTYHVAGRVDNPAQVFIGLHSDDTIIDAAVVPTTITGAATNQAAAGWQVGGMLIFSWPGSAQPLDQITILPTGTTAVILLNNPPAGVAVTVILRNGQVQTGGTEPVFELPEPNISAAAVAF